MKNQAIRKPKFLENIEEASTVIPLAFSVPETPQDNLETRLLGAVEARQQNESTHAPLKQKTTTPSFIKKPIENNETMEEPFASEEDETLSQEATTNLQEDTPDIPDTAINIEAQPQEVPPPQIATPTMSAPPEPQRAMGIDENIATEKMIRLIEQLKQANHRLAEEARSTALEIGFQVAQRILEKEVSGDVSAMMSLVRSALRESGDAKILRISLHPKDHLNITKALEEGQFREIALTQLELVPDAGLERGDVLVATDFGEIDGRVQTRLKEIKTVIDDSNEGEPYGTL